MKEQDEVSKWMVAFGQEVKTKPEIPSLEIRKLRAKLILEEALELIEGLGLVPFTTERLAEDDSITMERIDFSDFGIKPDLIKIADGSADLQVVNLGTASACGINIEPHFSEVMRSNWTKLWSSDDLEENYPDGLPEGWTCRVTHEHPEIEGYYSVLVKDQHGKVIKSPSYSPAKICF